jgi:hypothetical protein
VSDDVVLTRLLGAARRRAVYVPSCLAFAHGGHPKLGHALAWMRRQAQMVRYAALPLWVLALACFGVVCANLLAVPVLTVAAIFAPSTLPLLLRAAVGSLLFCVGAGLLRAGVRDGQPLAPWVLRTPLLIVLSYAALVASGFGRTVRWGDAEYRMGLDGRIRHIARR